MPEYETAFARHVYVKDRHARVPHAGDRVFVRESIAVKGELRQTVQRHHRGRREDVVLPVGYGGIIGGMSVTGRHRPIDANDLVYDYGDLNEWSIIECRDFERFRLPLDQLMVAIGHSADTPLRFLDLWRIPDEVLPRLLRSLGRD